MTLSYTNSKTINHYVIYSYIKGSYKLVGVFIIGLAVSIVLLIQKILFDKQL